MLGPLVLVVEREELHQHVMLEMLGIKQFIRIVLTRCCKTHVYIGA